VEGLPGVRAIGLYLEAQGIVQVSTNIEDFRRVRAADVVAAVRRHAPVQAAELVALAPEAALADFPADVPLRGFDPQRQIIERVLDS
jgi:glutamate formiminotransferase